MIGQASNADLDLADRLAEREREAGVARVQAAMRAGSGGRFICDCGAEIPEARRRAVPNTDTCFDCATFLERQQRRRA
jgi:phage/conjugal plasmid C-4 type zinc finger TraR family protein